MSPAAPRRAHHAFRSAASCFAVGTDGTVGTAAQMLGFSCSDLCCDRSEQRSEQTGAANSPVPTVPTGGPAGRNASMARDCWLFRPFRPVPTAFGNAGAENRSAIGIAALLTGQERCADRV